MERFKAHQMYVLFVLIMGIFLIAGCDGEWVPPVGLDTSAPIVTITSPVNGAVGIPINRAISAGFSEVMDPLTITDETFIVEQGGTAITGTVSYSDITAVFTPSINLDPDTEKEEIKMSAKKHFTKKQAREIGDKLGIDWSRVDVEQFRMGLDVELEHGLQDPSTDVTGDDPVLTGKIALAHINEFKDYYTRLDKMEREAREELGPSRSTEGTMHHSISSIIGFEIRATDGDLGKIDEFYFDDKTWIIRYVVVDAGNWLSGRKVLISPVAFGKLDLESRMIAVNLTSAQVSGSPDIDTQRPIHRQQEIELHEHYQWPWRGGYGGTFGSIPLPLSSDDVPAKPKVSASGHRDDPHLRSSRQVSGYRIHAIDGEIGHMEDFIIEDESWAIRFLVVDTRNWLPGKKVLLSPHWINRVEWADGSVHFDLTQESIKDSPEFDPARTVYRDYEVCLGSHYGRPVKVFGAVKIPKSSKRVKVAKKVLS